MDLLLLPNDLFNLIHSKYVTTITDIRTLSRVSKLYENRISVRFAELRIIYREKFQIFPFWNCSKRHKRKRLTVEMAIDGYQHLIPEQYYTKGNTVLCSILAFCGDYERFCTAIRRKCPTNNLSSCAGYNGNIQILYYLKNNGLLSTNGLFSSTYPMEDKVDILNWLNYNEYKIPTSAYEQMGKFSRINMLNWCRDNKKILDIHTIGSYAVIFGQILVLEWLFSNGYNLGPNLFGIATQNKRLNVLEWAHSKSRKPQNNDFINIAIVNDDLEIIKWAHEKQYDLSRAQWDMMKDAQILKWALFNKFVIPVNCWNEAQRKRNVNILKYLAEK